MHDKAQKDTFLHSILLGGLVGACARMVLLGGLVALTGCGPAEETLCPWGQHKDTVTGACVPDSLPEICGTVADVTLDVRDDLSNEPVRLSRLTVTYPRMCSDDDPNDLVGCGRIDINPAPDVPVGIYTLPAIPMCEEVKVDAVAPGYLVVTDWPIAFTETYKVVRLSHQPAQ